MPASLNIRLPPHEAAALEAYTAATQRTKSEIVRAFIRSLRSPASGSERRSRVEAGAKPRGARSHD
jgi:Ribbon-helix-helix protein, copG family